MKNMMAPKDTTVPASEDSNEDRDDPSAWRAEGDADRPPQLICQG